MSKSQPARCDYGYYHQIIAGVGWSSLPWLGLLAQPTLVMAGTDDPIVPVANGRILAKLIPDARLTVICSSLPGPRIPQISSRTS